MSMAPLPPCPRTRADPRRGRTPGLVKTCHCQAAKRWPPPPPPPGAHTQNSSTSNPSVQSGRHGTASRGLAVTANAAGLRLGPRRARARLARDRRRVMPPASAQGGLGCVCSRVLGVPAGGAGCACPESNVGARSQAPSGHVLQITRPPSELKGHLPTCAVWVLRSVFQRH